MCRIWLLVKIACLWAHGVNAAESSSAVGEFSPVKHFSESLTASSAHGCIVAITASGNDNGRPCVVIVSHSPSAPKSECLDITDETNDSESVVLSSRQSDGPLSSSLYLLNNGQTIMGMTGFAPDVQHVFKCAAQATMQYCHLVDSHGNDSKSMPLKKLVVQKVSRQLQRACLTSNGRPFGVQAVLVGSGDRHPFRPQIYTVDTAGGWNHWRSGMTAIGRNAKSVRQSLFKESNSMSENDKHLKSPATWDNALDLAIKCVLDSIFSKEDLVAMLGDSETSGKKLPEISRQFKAVILDPFNQNESTCFVVGAKHIAMRCHEVILQLQELKKATK